LSELKKLYKTIATDVWDRMKFALETNSKISETTLTENLLFIINKYRIRSGDNSVRIYESKDEKTNGNDLEIYLEIAKNKYILLAVQAKKLYTKEQKYKAINHKIDADFQIDLLLHYANSKKGLALYLLYNYAPDCTHANKEHFGCTLIEALYIKDIYYPKTKKRWKIPTFNDLHRCNHKLYVYWFKFIRPYFTFSRYAVPWHLLASNRCFKSYVDYYNANNSQPLKEYRQNEIIGDEWIEVKEYTGDEKVIIESYISNDKNFVNEDNPHKRFFNPKFKMVIELEKDNKYEETNNLP
jgi:hypothetical protein